MIAPAILETSKFPRTEKSLSTHSPLMKIMATARALSLALLATGTAFSVPRTSACTRFTYQGSDNFVLTGRNWDWNRGIKRDLWVLPAGLTMSMT